MVQMKKKLLVLLLSAAMLLSTGQGVWSEPLESTPDGDTSSAETSDTDEGQSGENTEGNADTDSGDSGESTGPIVVGESVTEEEALAKMKEYASNSKLVLYLNEETGAIALKNKANNYVWWSTPYNVDADPISNPSRKNELKSALQIVTASNGSMQTDPKNSKPDVVDKNGMSVEPVDGGFKITYNFTDANIKVPMIFTLKDDYLDMTIDTKEIAEGDLSLPTTSFIQQMSVMPAFGAATTEDTGYFIIPDGSGAVIEYNSKKTNAKEYTGKVYGSDDAFGKFRASAKTQNINLPMIGMVNGNNGLVAVVDQGDAHASIRANISKASKPSSYNVAWFDFAIRSSDKYTIGTSGATLSIYEQGNILLDKIAIRYYPISDDKVDYVDIANTYRDYLIKDKGLTQKNTGDVPLFLDIYGGTYMQQSIVGIPVNVETAATTYKQAQEILTKLKDLGVGNMLVNYRDYSASGITGRIPSGVDFSSTLGGEKAFKELQAYAESNGIQIFPEVDIQEYQRSGNGYSKTGHSSIRISKAYATQDIYEMAYGTPNRDRESYTISSPFFHTDMLKKISENFAKKNLTNVSLAKGTTMLYSDFGARLVSRQQAASNITAGYQALKDNNLNILAKSANQYALPYVDYVSDVPLYSSNFDIFEYDIPFYQLVIQGMVPHSSTAINKSSDATKHLLLSIATGSAIHFDFIYADPDDFATTEYEYLYHAKYSGWLDLAANEYKLTQEIIAPLKDKKIVSFAYTSKDVIETEFEGGTKIKVDLVNDTLQVNGKDINLADYGVKGGIAN